MSGKEFKGADDLYGHHDLRRRQDRPEGDEFVHISQAFVKKAPLAPEWLAFIGRCESPIEKDLCTEFIDALSAVPAAGQYDFDEVKGLADRSPTKTIIVAYAQQEIGPYRADFVLAFYDVRSDRFCRIVVECDGHEFHQARFEDQRRDFIRDRYMRMHGYWVLRFSGREIKSGATDLATKVATILTAAR